MENRLQEVANKELEALQIKKITRKEAIKKAGYIAVSAATTMILLGTPKTASASPAPPPCETKPNNSGQNHGPWKK